VSGPSLIATTVAAEILTVLVMPLATLDDLVRTRPRLAAEIGESLELKRRLATQALATVGVAAGVLGVDAGPRSPLR